MASVLDVVAKPPMAVSLGQLATNRVLASFAELAEIFALLTAEYAV